MNNRTTPTTLSDDDLDAVAGGAKPGDAKTGIVGAGGGSDILRPNDVIVGEGGGNDILHDFPKHKIVTSGGFNDI